MRSPILRIALPLLLFLALQEALLRVVFPLPEVTNFQRHEYSPLHRTAGDDASTSLGHASFRWVSDPDGVDFVHRLNLYGFRDRTWALRSRADVTRVAFIGDSFVEGFSTDAENTIPEVFRDLAEQRGLRLETLNLGVGAGDLKTYVALIRDAIPLFRPHSVILVLYANDFIPFTFDPRELENPLQPQLSSRWQPRLVHVLAELGKGRRIPRRWTERPFLYLAAVPDPRNPWSRDASAAQLGSFVEPRIAEAMRRGRFNPALSRWFVWARKALSRPTDITPHLRGIEQYLERLGSELFVVYLPTKNQVTDRYLAHQAEFVAPGTVASLLGEEFQVHAAYLRSSCAALGLPVLDLSPELKEWEAQGPPLYWSYDDHLRPRGYRRVGERIFRWWSEQR
jgi:hypothetical protein